MIIDFLDWFEIKAFWMKYRFRRITKKYSLCTTLTLHEFLAFMH